LQTNNDQKFSLYRRLNSLATLFIIGGLVFVADQLTKAMVLKNLKMGDVWTPVPDWEKLFRIIRTSNTGAAFGLFSKGGNFFMIVAIIVILIIIYYIATYPALPKIVQISLGLQLGGAFGNMWDRVQHGSVVDFVDIGFWPIFNVADISIMIGVTILAVWLWQEDEKQQNTVAGQDVT
jgi:signal peptidase II